jgi:hypothetical protein
MIKLWCFGEEHLLPKLQNAAMRALIANFGNTHTSVQAVRTVNEISQDESRVWKVVMNELAHDYNTIKHDPNAVEELKTIPGVIEDLIERLRGAPDANDSRSLPYSEDMPLAELMVKEE